jgi:hypothetical protein
LLRDDTLEIITGSIDIGNCLHPTTLKRTLRIIQMYVLLQRPKIGKVPGFAFVVASLETMLVNWRGILPLVFVENGLSGTKTHQASIIKTSCKVQRLQMCLPKVPDCVGVFELLVPVFVN